MLIDNAIEAYESWTENAENELKKKFKGVEPTDYNSKMKQKQFLFNRGFSTQIIERIL
jgi:SOS response regulatory protein OraA/RecX